MNTRTKIIPANKPTAGKNDGRMMAPNAIKESVEDATGSISIYLTELVSLLFNLRPDPPNSKRHKCDCKNKTNDPSKGIKKTSPNYRDGSV